MRKWHVFFATLAVVPAVSVAAPFIVARPSVSQRFAAPIRPHTVIRRAAATASPGIVYKILGSGGVWELWLVNPDGSGSVRIYRAASGHTIGDLQMKPGGGMVAITEGIQGQVSTAVKVIAYNLSTNTQTVSVVPQPSNCWNTSVDYRADGLLLFNQRCNSDTLDSIDEWDGNTVRAVLANPDYGPGTVRWLKDGSGFLWVASGAHPTGMELRESLLSNPLAWTVVWEIPANMSQLFDLAHQTDAILISQLQVPMQVLKYPFIATGVGPQTALAPANSEDGHYSPDDSQIVYRQVLRKGYNLVVKNLATGATATIASGDIRSVDWNN